jgi:hypothetical protein
MHKGHVKNHLSQDHLAVIIEFVIFEHGRRSQIITITRHNTHPLPVLANINCKDIYSLPENNTPLDHNKDGTFYVDLSG